MTIILIIVALIFIKIFRVPIRRNSCIHIKWLIYRISSKVNQSFKNYYGPCDTLGLSIYTRTHVILWLLQGDPNVPASEVSLIGDLTSPLVLTLEQQENLTALPEYHAMEKSGPTVRQPFRIPEDFSDRDNRYIPEFCTFRYDVQNCTCTCVYDYIYLKRLKPYVFVRVFSKVSLCIYFKISNFIELLPYLRIMKAINVVSYLKHS